MVQQRCCGWLWSVSALCCGYLSWSSRCPWGCRGHTHTSVQAGGIASALISAILSVSVNTFPSAVLKVQSIGPSPEDSFAILVIPGIVRSERTRLDRVNASSTLSSTNSLGHLPMLEDSPLNLGIRPFKRSFNQGTSHRIVSPYMHPSQYAME